MINLAQRLEKLRTEKNISRAELAVKLGFPKNSVEKFETGRLTPSKDQQQKLAKFFGVSVEYLQGVSDSPADMSSWLEGNYPEEHPAEAPKPQPSQQKIVSRSGSESNEDKAVYHLLLKSDSFREAVLEVLRSPEGKELLAKLIKEKR